MVNLMRKYQQGLLMIVTFIIIICFAWLYNDNRFRPGGAEAIGAIIYEKPVKVIQIERGARRAQLGMELQAQELLMALAGNARSEGELFRNVSLNSYVLHHEAETLGIEPTQDEIEARIKDMRIFQTNGAFDRNKYANFISNIPKLGFGPDEIESIVRDWLRVQKLRELVTGNLSAPPGEVRRTYEEMNQKSEVSFVRVKEEDISKEVTVSEEDIKKAFEERKDTFQSDEMRKVKFVPFLLTEEEKKLSGAQRSSVFQKLVDKAQEFAVAMTAPEAKLEEVAQKFGVTVAETPEFPRRKPPVELEETDAAANAAFDKLTLEKPNSDAIPSEKRDGYFVLQLTGITPSRPQTFEEVKEKLAETLKRDRVNELLTTRTTELRAKLDAELKAGKTFEDAAKTAGLTLETIPAFSQSAPPDGTKNPDGMMIARASSESAVGQLSEPLPVASGRIIYRVEKRLPIDEAAFEKEKPNLVQQISRGLAEQVFRLWIQERIKAANIKTGATQS